MAGLQHPTIPIKHLFAAARGAVLVPSSTGADFSHSHKRPNSGRCGIRLVQRVSAERICCCPS